MVEEQDKDEMILKIKQNLKQDTVSPSFAKNHIILDGILYYISHVDTDPFLRLYVPKHLQNEVIAEYHNTLGHMGIDKTYDAIHLKYYWVNLFKMVSAYVNKCQTCQLRSSQKRKPPVQEMDIPPYPWAKCAVDVSGPYPTSLSGNKYIISFIDLFSGFP